MKPTAILLVVLCLFGLPAQGGSKLSKEDCRAILADFEHLSNINPREVEKKAPEVLDRLRNGASLTDYFVAYNIYAENLFNQGHVEKARTEIDEMLSQANRHDEAECKVIALRTQGQFYYKLGLFGRAEECFRQAMQICPRYDSKELEHCFTWSSTLFWLVQSDIRNHHPEEAERWISKMQDMMKWLDSQGKTDSIGYKQVMILGLKAKIEIMRGNNEEARKLLEECPQYILPDIPKRAYVEYYVARMLLSVKEGRHAEALPLLDDLIEMHRDDYKPIAAEFMYQKGSSLFELGRYEESAATLREYIEMKGKLNETAMAEQLNESAARYEVEKLQHERDNIQKQLAIVLAVCTALAIIIALVVVNQRKLRRKNMTLANNISEFYRLGREGAGVMRPAVETANPEDEGDVENSAEDSRENELLEAQLVETGKKVVEYINSSKCYLRSDCSRDTIKEGTGVTERILAKAIVSATGLSFVNYINRLRLDASIELLEEKREMTIHDISSACGFGTVRQFQRIFKQRYGLSPSAYREARNSEKEN